MCILGIEKRAQTYVTRQFDKTTMETQTAKGLGEKFLGQIPGNFGGKAAHVVAVKSLCVLGIFIDFF